MFIATFPAGPWQTNCYVLATEKGSECVIVDPGMDAAGPVREVVTENRLQPVAVMLTHGHLDHLYSVTPVCSAYDSTCWIHPDDRALLADPMRAMSPETAALLRRLTGREQSFVEPDDVRELADSSVLTVAGLDFSCLHAPGHTPGSTMFRTSDTPDAEVDSLVLTGDVVFAGSIGRTDLPGGSTPDMLNSLRTKVLPLPDSALLLPGHGPQTTMARERSTNPYLREQHLRSTT